MATSSLSCPPWAADTIQTQLTQHKPQQVFMTFGRQLKCTRCGQQWRNDALNNGANMTVDSPNSVNVPRNIAAIDADAQRLAAEGLLSLGQVRNG